MPRYDFISQRLFVSEALAPGSTIELDRGQSNYLINVLRLKDEAKVLLFNGRDGEWQAQLKIAGRKKVVLEAEAQTRTQPPPYDLYYLFAPLKQARMEYMIQKAVEMGVGHIQPVLTEYTQTRKLNSEKMAAYALEAAEQCGILSLPQIHEIAPLDKAVEALPTQRQIIFCDEGDAHQNPLAALNRSQDTPLALLIGPEGGFSPSERQFLRSRTNVTPIPLGPRVLRADTAAVAALALIQASVGDWQD